MYVYRAQVIRIVDADTLHAAIDLGLDTYQNHTIRLAGIDAPEQGTPEGRAATDFVRTLIEPGQTVYLRTIKDRREKFGRYLGWIFTDPDDMATVDRSVNFRLVEEGHAVEYRGALA